MEVDFQRQEFCFKPMAAKKIESTGNIKFGLPCPHPRSGHRIVTDGANVYSFGGYHPDIQDEDEEDSSPLFRELWKFNLVSKTWLKLSTKGLMPEELVSHSALLVENKLFVFGGTGFPFAEKGSNSWHICDLKTLQWNPLKTTSLAPDEQYGQAIAFYKGYLYVVGGTNGFVYTMDVHRLHLETKNWEELKTDNKPKARYRHEIAILDNKIYVFGGGTATESFGFTKVPVFDIEKRVWQSCETHAYLDAATNTCSFPRRRRCHSCVQSGSDVYICGGHDGTSIYDDIWKLHMPSMRWKRFNQSLPCPLYFHSATLTSDGEMFIFGGVTSIGSHIRTNSLYSVYLTVPSLRHMAWAATQHYVNLCEHSKESLLEAGIPQLLLNTIYFHEDSSPRVNVRR